MTRKDISVGDTFVKPSGIGTIIKKTDDGVVIKSSSDIEFFLSYGTLFHKLFKRVYTDYTHINSVPQYSIF